MSDLLSFKVQTTSLIIKSLTPPVYYSCTLLSLCLCSAIEEPVITSLEDEEREDDSVLIQIQIRGGKPKESYVTWFWDSPGLKLLPGEISGKFSALNKTVSVNI